MIRITNGQHDFILSLFENLFFIEVWSHTLTQLFRLFWACAQHHRVVWSPRLRHVIIGRIYSSCQREIAQLASRLFRKLPIELVDDNILFFDRLERLWFSVGFMRPFRRVQKHIQMFEVSWSAPVFRYRILLRFNVLFRRGTNGWDFLHSVLSRMNLWRKSHGSEMTIHIWILFEISEV